MECPLLFLNRCSDGCFCNLIIDEPCSEYAKNYSAWFDRLKQKTWDIRVNAVIIVQKHSLWAGWFWISYEPIVFRWMNFSTHFEVFLGPRPWLSTCFGWMYGLRNRGVWYQIGCWEEVFSDKVYGLQILIAALLQNPHCYLQIWSVKRPLIEPKADFLEAFWCSEG